jgi:cytochrome P450
MPNTGVAAVPVMTDPDSVPPPPHVPRGLVVDFDYYNPPGAERDFQGAWKRMQDESNSDLVWTGRNGGHWIPLRGTLISKILSDPEHFSSRLVIIPESRGKDQQVLPTTLDPPRHGAYRALLNPGLSPKAVLELESFIRATAGELIDAFSNDGYCDLVQQY